MPTMIKIFSEDIGIDLGTGCTIVADKNGNILINEPSVVAIDINTYEVLAVGKEAKDMIGKTPDNILAVKPMENGVIADFETTLAMVSYFIKKAVNGFALFQPRVVVTVPSLLTDVERRSVEDVVLHAGARDVVLIEENIATIIGLGIDVFKPMGHFCVNVGAGTTEASIVSLGGVVTGHCEKIGGDFIDEEIMAMVKKNYRLLIGLSTAEKIKEKIGTINMEQENTYIDVSGRDLVTGMPKTIVLQPSDIIESINPVVEGVINAIKTVLEKTPPEIAADIVKEGIFFAGGLSQLDGLKEYVRDVVGIDIIKLDDPVNVTGIGVGKAVKDFKTFKSRS